MMMSMRVTVVAPEALTLADIMISVAVIAGRVFRAEFGFVFERLAKLTCFVRIKRHDPKLEQVLSAWDIR